jgi:hypothetical protein
VRHAETLAFKSKSTIPQSFDFNGGWRNELGSMMTLRVDGETVSGDYVSAVSEQGSGPTPPYPLHGTTTGDLIAFSVNWGSEITTWTGHAVTQADGHDSIPTLWQIVQAVPNETDPENPWKMILSGADAFWR